MSDFLEYVVTHADDDLPAMLGTRIIPSFLHTVRRNGATAFTGTLLRAWAVDMMFDRKKAATARRYIGALHTLYKKWLPDATGFPAEDPFKDVLKTLPEEDPPADSEVRANLRLLRGPHFQHGGPHFQRKCDAIERSEPISSGGSHFQRKCESTAVDVFLWLLYSPQTTLSDVINLRRTADPGVSQLVELAERSQRDPRAQYLFPLEQGQKRPPRIAADLVAAMSESLKARGMQFEKSFSRDSITALWVRAAYDSGVPAGAIRSLITAVPAEYPFLSLLSPEAVGERETRRILERVADSICDRTPRWFVMRLRGGHTPDDVRRQLFHFRPEMKKSLMFYYPTRTIYKVKKKNAAPVPVETPWLPDILFFRTHRDRIGTIFHHIGDLAWCFRLSGAGSPYTAISLTEMQRFQRHIGSFTPDVEMTLTESAPAVRVGDMVKVVGDLFEGKEGEVQSIRRAGGKTLYGIRLTDSLYIRWERLELDSALVEPLPST